MSSEQEALKPTKKIEAMKQNDDSNLRKKENRIERVKKFAENEDQTSTEELNQCCEQSIVMMYRRRKKKKSGGKDRFQIQMPEAQEEYGSEKQSTRVER
ncbi:hypothetical protein B9Z55_021817 [Caenorhabditis nigoni]|nr:hypothetical protein B9Z55_021817 [Caenorhabditis nigoni]